MKKYHKQLGIPAHLLPSGGMLVHWTGHALQNWRDDHRFDPGWEDTPRVVDFREWDIIEVKAEKKKWDEVLVRKAFAVGMDVCLVVTSSRRVKTCWFQASSDHNKSLDVSKYDIP